MNKAALLFSGLMLLGMATTTFASDRVLQPDAIISQQQQIRPDLQTGKGAYAKLSPVKRNELLARQDRLLELLQPQTPPVELDEAQRSEAFAAIDAIQAAGTPAVAVTSNDDDTLVCKREKTLGSNFSTKVCRTKAQIRYDQENARGNLESGTE